MNSFMEHHHCSNIYLKNKLKAKKDTGSEVPPVSLIYSSINSIAMFSIVTLVGLPSVNTTLVLSLGL